VSAEYDPYKYYLLDLLIECMINQSINQSTDRWMDGSIKQTNK